MPCYLSRPPANYSISFADPPFSLPALPSALTVLIYYLLPAWLILQFCLNELLVLFDSILRLGLV
jgi:hypothetical protein